MEQRLNCAFDDYPRLVQTILEAAEANPGAHQIDLYIAASGKAVLELYSKNEMRNFLLLSFEFVAAPTKLVEQALYYRYTLAQSKNRLLEGRLFRIYEIVKQSNPSLGLQVKDLITKN